MISAQQAAELKRLEADAIGAARKYEAIGPGKPLTVYHDSYQIFCAAQTAFTAYVDSLVRP